MKNNRLNAIPFATACLCDAHTHIGTEEELAERRKNTIPSLVCAVNPDEAKKLVHLSSKPENSSTLIPTFGLHPWYADRYFPSEMELYISKCHVIGEIGMDSVWCKVPLNIQEKVFTRQLAIACEMQKPVILHTKGQEKKIAGLISKYPNTYLVHWYSSPDFPDVYLTSNCYFSIGPDVWWNPSVRRLVSELPQNRLLIETDGMDAVKWAFHEAPRQLQTPAARTASSSVTLSLSFTLKQIAKIRHLPFEEAEKLICANFTKCFGPSLPI